VKNIYHWLLLIVSAHAYACAFVCNAYLWWLSLLFLFPFFLALNYSSLSFIHGFVWAFIAVFYAMSGLFFVLMGISGDAWIVGFCLGLLMVLFCSVCGGIVMMCAHMVIKKYAIVSVGLRYSVYGIALFVFFWFLDSHCLLLVGLPEGCPLLYPLLPLAHQPSLLWIVPYSGAMGLLLMVIGITICMMIYHTWRWCLLYSLFFVVYYELSCVFYVPAERPMDMPRIGAVPCMMRLTSQSADCVMQMITRRLKNFLIRYPSTEIVVMPESSLNGLTEKDFRCLNHESLGKPIHIIFGSERVTDQGLYNTAYYLYNGELRYYCDKQHAVVMTEQLGWFLDTPFFRELYFNKAEQIVTSRDCKQRIVVGDLGACVLYICSELFSAKRCLHQGECDIIIALVNDLSFSLYMHAEYIHELLLLLAQYKAIIWRQNIVYISYHYAFFIDTHGICHALNNG